MRRIRQRTAEENPGAGEDSFLDIVSNMVGILIILVMIAGVRLGDAQPDENQPGPETVQTALDTAEPLPQPEPMAETAVETAESAVELVEEPAPEPIETALEEPAVSEEEQSRYLEAAEQIEKHRTEICALQTEVDRLNEQTVLLKSQTEGSQAEYTALMEKTAQAEALIERLGREKSEEEKTQIERNAELVRLAEEEKRLTELKQQLASVRPKSTLLENVPTPLTKKIEGNEAVFVLTGGRISYVPIGEFSERVRGIFRSMRDIKNDRIDETLGPVDNYRFHFQASLHKIQTGDGTRMSIVFDGGEFLPAAAEMGEPIESALTENSQFRRKLALFLQDSSTITLAVYPDSFEELRDVKKYLIQNGYNIALRPMPAGKNIRISPNGTESTAY